MLRTLWTSKSGMNAQQNKLDTISNNIANSSTTGYKRVDVGFKDLLSESLNRKGYPINNTNAIMGTGVKTTEVYRESTQGYLLDTSVSTNLAIDGEGYFRVVREDGSYAYTRDGSFRIDGEGKLVDSKGNNVYIEYTNGYTEETVSFLTANLLVDTAGGVYTKQGETFIKVGNIPLYTAIGDDAFLSIAENLYVPAEGVQVNRTTNADIYQGFLEGSNVDIATEFTDMIVTQRAFQLSSKGIQTADEMWGMINSLRR